VTSCVGSYQQSSRSLSTSQNMLFGGVYHGINVWLTSAPQTYRRSIYSQNERATLVSRLKCSRPACPLREASPLFLGPFGTLWTILCVEKVEEDLHTSLASTARCCCYVRNTLNCQPLDPPQVDVHRFLHRWLSWSWLEPRGPTSFQLVGAVSWRFVVELGDPINTKAMMMMMMPRLTAGPT